MALSRRAETSAEREPRREAQARYAEPRSRTRNQGRPEPKGDAVREKRGPASGAGARIRRRACQAGESRARLHAPGWSSRRCCDRSNDVSSGRVGGVWKLRSLNGKVSGNQSTCIASTPPREPPTRTSGGVLGGLRQARSARPASTRSWARDSWPMPSMTPFRTFNVLTRAIGGPRDRAPDARSRAAYRVLDDSYGGTACPARVRSTTGLSLSPKPCRLVRRPARIAGTTAWGRRQGPARFGQTGGRSCASRSSPQPAKAT